MPGTVESTSRNDNMFCSAIVSPVTTVMVCGVSSSGAVYLGEESCLASGSPTTVTVPSWVAGSAAGTRVDVAQRAAATASATGGRCSLFIKPRIPGNEVREC